MAQASFFDLVWELLGLAKDAAGAYEKTAGRYVGGVKPHKNESALRHGFRTATFNFIGLVILVAAFLVASSITHWSGIWAQVITGLGGLYFAGRLLAHAYAAIVLPADLVIKGNQTRAFGMSLAGPILLGLVILVLLGIGLAHFGEIP